MFRQFREPQEWEYDTQEEYLDFVRELTEAAA